jgi:hypothetical protein
VYKLWETWLCVAMVPRVVELDNGIVASSVRLVEELSEIEL